MYFYTVITDAYYIENEVFSRHCLEDSGTNNLIILDLNEDADDLTMTVRCECDQNPPDPPVFHYFTVRDWRVTPKTVPGFRKIFSPPVIHLIARVLTRSPEEDPSGRIRSLEGPKRFERFLNVNQPLIHIRGNVLIISIFGYNTQGVSGVTSRALALYHGEKRHEFVIIASDAAHRLLIPYSIATTKFASIVDILPSLQEVGIHLCILPLFIHQPTSWSDVEIHVSG